MKSKKGKTESPGKAKSRIKRFEQHLECGHRLALTYASNQPGSVPKVPGLIGSETGPWEPKPEPTPPDETDIEPGPRNPAVRGRR